MINRVSRRRMVRLMMRRLVPHWTVAGPDCLAVVDVSRAANLSGMVEWDDCQTWSQWWMEPMPKRDDLALFLNLDMRSDGKRHQFALGFSVRRDWLFLQALSNSLTLHLGFAAARPQAGETVKVLVVQVSDSLRKLLIGLTRKEA